MCIQNSIRHSLSLGHYFRKVQSASGYQGRKGCFWEFVPEKKANIVAEVERFLKQERRSLMKSEKQVPASLGELYIYPLCIIHACAHSRGDIEFLGHA